jgi:hypothetical protein
MENIGDWLYVLILVIAGISSIFSSIRKKSQQATTQNQQNRQPQQARQQQAQPHREIIKEDVFDDDFWGDQTKKVPEMPAPVAKPQPKAKQTSKVPPTQVNYDFYKINEGQSIFTKGNSPIFADNEEENALITLEDLPSETEEWRKALVYNEILNRKY